MNIRKLFGLIIVMCIAFSMIGKPMPVLAQESLPNSDLVIDEFQLPQDVMPQGITVAPNGDVWFGNWNGSSIGRLKTDGTSIEYPTISGSNTLYPTVGADGNIWFTELGYGNSSAGRIGRITTDAPDGSITEFKSPNFPNFAPFDLTLGPDGNIWFTHGESGTIGKVTPGGSITEYPVPNVDSLHGITSGPDGNIWFASFGNNVIGKMTLNGEVTEYAIPGGSIGPDEIVTGPDENLWFTELWGTNIGRITPNGDITQFALPSSSLPYRSLGITTGSDGNLWFTEPSANQIGRITPAGSITEFSIPTPGSQPTCITSGPDGNLWFTEAIGRKIGRITINRSPVITSIAAPVTPVQLGHSIDATIAFSDSDLGDIHSVSWDWGDGSTTTALAAVPSVTTSHTYASTGVYTITGTITDRAGLSASAIFQYVVVYDPDGGFVTGGGWINSPAGAYTADPSLSGKATFGFVSKYKKGANVPSGDTEFQLQVASMNFKSTSYDWLVIAGTKAQYKGTGLINGSGNYGFMLTATDGVLDKFRIKILDKATNSIIYDNMISATDDANPTTTLGGGSIVIHK